MALKSTEGIEDEKLVADRPGLRMYLASLNSSLEPQDSSPGVWVVCSPDTLERLSAVPYYFATEIQRDLKVPVGMLRVAWGGSHIETWMPSESLESFPSVMTFKANEDRRQLLGIPDAQPWKTYPGKLYNGMIHPLAPYGLKGVLWYQGESNAHTVSDAILYRDQLASLAVSWRTRWGEELPIYAVQLPNYRAATTEENAWAYLRESVLHFRNKVPGIGMAVAIDVGNPDDIHPKNKRPVSKRLARQALVYTYGKSLVPGGPLYRSIAKQGNRIIVSFDDVGSGLASADGNPLCWFEIAGDDKKFVPANAKIENDTVVVSSAQVCDPVAVRYAWANNPEGCNLINRDGFPASPFRTDTWDPVTP
jgi:sialate O-acetylesterase